MKKPTPKPKPSSFKPLGFGYLVSQGVWWEVCAEYWLMVTSTGLMAGLWRPGAGASPRVEANGISLSGDLRSVFAGDFISLERLPPLFLPELVRRHPAYFRPNLRALVAPRAAFAIDKAAIIVEGRTRELVFRFTNPHESASIWATKPPLDELTAQYFDWWLPTLLRRSGWQDPRPWLAISQLLAPYLRASFRSAINRRLGRQAVADARSSRASAIINPKAVLLAAARRAWWAKELSQWETRGRPTPHSSGEPDLAWFSNWLPLARPSRLAVWPPRRLIDGIQILKGQL